jgi:hypothetical protein
MAAATALVPAAAAGSPNVAQDDPVYDAIDQRALAGDGEAALAGGVAPLTETRVHELVGDGEAAPDGAWLRPIDRAALRVEAAHETERGYSTPARPRNVAGELALACEDQQGRPCGHGAGLAGELDAAAGHGAWLAGAVRLRAQTGSARYATALAVDRAYAAVELGPIAAEVGRDELALGPAAHTRLGWSTNPPPLDQLRLSGVRPLALAPQLHVNAVYVLGRLAAPQTDPGDLVSITRAELDIAGRLELGMMQLLQLGGDGAPGFGVWDFVLEHVRRRDPTASASDSSNRRVGLDVAARIDGFGGARITYQLIFEDLRKHFADAVRYDADHALGFETRWLAVEWRHTGARSYEHMPRVTGFTSGGRIAGDPLGPAAHAVFAGARIPVPRGLVMPWAEVAALASDSYEFIAEGPIVKTAAGPSELRLRLGARARIAIDDRLELEPEAAVEGVERAAYVAGARRVNAVVRAVIAWRPRR